VRWDPTDRIIRSIFPPIDRFEDIADPADWDAVASAEAKLNPRATPGHGDFAKVPVERRVSGPGASFVSAGLEGQVLQSCISARRTARLTVESGPLEARRDRRDPTRPPLAYGDPDGAQHGPALSLPRVPARRRLGAQAERGL
jgi:hypothetical protein